MVVSYLNAFVIDFFCSLFGKNSFLSHFLVISNFCAFGSPVKAFNFILIFASTFERDDFLFKTLIKTCLFLKNFGELVWSVIQV